MANENENPGQGLATKAPTAAARLKGAIETGIVKTDAPAGAVKPAAGADNNGKPNPAAPATPEGQGAGAGQGQQQQQPPAEGAPEGIDDAKVLAFLKSKGIEAASLEDLKRPVSAEALSEDDKKRIAEEKRTRAIKYGIENKKFSQADYDARIKFEAMDPLDVVQADYVARVKKAYPDMSDDDAREMFELQYFLMESDQDSPRYKQGQQLLVDEYNRLKADRFGKIDGIEKDYEQHETFTARKASFDKQVKEIVAAIPKTISFKIAGQDQTAPIDQSELDAITANYLTTETMEALLDQTGKVNAEVLTEEIMKDIFWKNKDTIMSEIATSFSAKALKDAEKGRKAYFGPEHVEPQGGGKVNDANSVARGKLNGAYKTTNS